MCSLLPIVRRNMLRNSQQYTITFQNYDIHTSVQIRAENVTPVTALVQNLVMIALFEPFEALCSAANAEIAEVRMPALKHDRRGLLNRDIAR